MILAVVEVVRNISIVVVDRESNIKRNCSGRNTHLLRVSYEK